MLATRMKAWLPINTSNTHVGRTVVYALQQYLSSLHGPGKFEQNKPVHS